MTYQLLRIAMTEATATHADIDRASYKATVSIDLLACQTLGNHHNYPNFTALALVPLVFGG